MTRDITLADLADSLLTGMYFEEINIFLNITVIGVMIYLGYKIRHNYRSLNKQIVDVGRKVENRVSVRLEEKTREIQNTIALEQLGFRYPLFLGGWSIDSHLGKYLVQHVLEQPPQFILELGSGSSTLLIARWMNLLGHVGHKHIAVDHEERYLKLTRDMLALNELSHNVELMTCPLQPLEDTGKLWYSGLTGRLADKKIDLLFIDGPPGILQAESRYPALPMLYPFLSEHCVVILDDAMRPDEQSIVGKWMEAHPSFGLEIVSEGHGFAVLRR